METTTRRSSAFESLRTRAGIAAMVAALALTALAPPAAARLKTCKTSITACPCAVKKATPYVLAKSLVCTSSSLDCLTVTHTGAVIDLAGQSITGPGGAATGAGIHVLAAASRVLIEGGGFNNSINGFGTGILIDASNVAVYSIELTSNAQFGAMIDGGSNNAIYDLDAGMPSDASSGNGIAGVMIHNGTGNLIDDIHADHNTMYGIEISGGSNNAIHDSDGDFNDI